MTHNNTWIWRQKAVRCYDTYIIRTGNWISMSIWSISRHFFGIERIPLRAATLRTIQTITWELPKCGIGNAIINRIIGHTTTFWYIFHVNMVILVLLDFKSQNTFHRFVDLAFGILKFSGQPPKRKHTVMIWKSIALLSLDILSKYSENNLYLLHNFWGKQNTDKKIQANKVNTHKHHE